MTPGYGDEVIFADGTFIDGSTAELSADGPIRPPYVVYCQVRRARCWAAAQAGAQGPGLQLVAWPVGRVVSQPGAAGIPPLSLSPAWDPTPQGGTHWTHWAYVLESAVAAMRQADAAASGAAAGQQ